MPVRVVTDSSSDLPRDLVTALRITVVPLTVNFGEERFLDGIDIDNDTFYRRLVESTVLPSTSQPPASRFIDAFVAAGNDDHILSIHPAEEFSGTTNVARQVARDLANSRRIEVIDSRTTSMGMGLVVLKAAQLASTGAPLEQVLEATRCYVSRSRVCFTVGTLSFLARGGRIGNAERLLGTLLRTKPVLTIRNGTVEPVAQPRTRAGALAALVRFAQERRPLSALSIGYSTECTEIDTLAEELSRFYPRTNMLVTRAGPAIGTHVGPGFLGVALLQDKPVRGSVNHTWSSEAIL
jgi:DegV family protein with EDD domain